MLSTDDLSFVLTTFNNANDGTENTCFLSFYKIYNSPYKHFIQ